MCKEVHIYTDWHVRKDLLVSFEQLCFKLTMYEIALHV